MAHKAADLIGRNVATRAISIHITGIVQGVGFRPFIYNLAIRHHLRGWVLNSSDGVYCVAQGDTDAVAAFLRAIQSEAPPMSVIDALSTEEIQPREFPDFRIEESRTVEGAMTLVSPDIATCEPCSTELFDRADRRFRYPFINCTNCGPRFTIIDDVPYDRPATTMRIFTMCPECDKEYSDPGDRRFHAQPNACFVCGPRLYLNVSGGEESCKDFAWTPEKESDPRPHRDSQLEQERSDTIIAEASSFLSQGKIIAIKGLGGFHLACDAVNEAVVRLLRTRKHRWGKPMAIMVRDIASARRYCHINAEEESLLTSTSRPIVLLSRADGPNPVLAPSISGNLPEIGVVLPYTPLHHLLMSAVPGPLVMTSGNLSEEPIAIGNEEALERLSRIADAFLLHDREIHSRYDDSVFRVVGEVVEPIRRARGYAPHPIMLPGASAVDILAVGPEQKNTFTLIKGSSAFVSQHIGDMENKETLEHFEQTLELYRKLFRIDPKVVAHDLHPEYLSTKFAHELGLPKIGVQHHHAHIVSVTAEHGITQAVAGLAFDGTGFGSDGRIWGGEVLLADWEGFERIAHLAYMPMPGGAAAIRRPARMAIGTLHATGLLDHPGADPLRARLLDNEERLLLKMVDQNINCPLTSSIGRLFDTVAAITGVRDDAAYEGEAAIELEACADTSARGTYKFELITENGTVIIDPRPVLLGVLEDVHSGRRRSEISHLFHQAVICIIVKLADIATGLTGNRHVALAGGVFMNRIVLEGALRKLTGRNFLPLTHVRLPTNDGAISFGQAVIARSLHKNS